MGTYKSWRITSEAYLSQDELNRIAEQIKLGYINGQVYTENFLPSKSTQQLKAVMNEEPEVDYSNYLQKCRDLIKQGATLQAVKHYRDATQSGLRDAKLAIDEMLEDMRSTGELQTVQSLRWGG